MSVAIGSAENPVCCAAKVDDATGIALTVTTKQVTLPILKSATLLVETKNVGMTFSPTDGTFTILTAGAYEGHAEIGLATNSVNAHDNLFQFFKNTTKLGNMSQRRGPAAEVGQSQGGIAFLADLVAGDVITVKADSNNDGDVITVKQASIILRRVGP